MKPMILKKPLIIIACLCIVFFSCEKKSELVNVTIKVVDSKTKKPRENDSIELRIEKFGFPVKQYPLVAIYVSDSNGEAKIKVQKDEVYHLIVSGEPMMLGFADFGNGNMGNGSFITVDMVKIKI